MSGLRLLLKNEASKVFDGTDNYSGADGNEDLVRRVDTFLRARGQMGLLVGGVLNKELPRKDLDVIVTGHDIGPAELGVDWWWVDSSTGLSKNVNNFVLPVSAVARRVLSRRLPGLHILRDLYDIKNEGLPATYTTSQEIGQDRSSPILDTRLFSPILVNYKGQELIGILEAYDETFMELSDAVVLPGIKESTQYGFARDFANVSEGVLMSGLTRLFFYQMLTQEVVTNIEIERIKNEKNIRICWGNDDFRKNMYLILNSDELWDAEDESRDYFDAKVEKVLGDLLDYKLKFDQQKSRFETDVACYAFLRESGSLIDYFDILDVEWKSERRSSGKGYYELVEEHVLRGDGRYIGNLVLNKLEVGEIRS